mgnify:CR=1 FL=1
MRTVRALALVGAVAAGFPAFAENCRSAPDLERELLQTPVQPFLAGIRPARPDPGWSIGPQGGFQIPARGLGEVAVLRGAAAELGAACGLRVSWAPQWNGGRVVSASRFKVADQENPEQRASVKFAATTFRVTPDTASQTAWLTVIEDGRSENHLLDFPATAISLLPDLHSDSLRLEMAGMRADGFLIYAEFGALKKR